MSAADLTMVIVAVASVVGAVVLVFALLATLRTLRQVRDAVELFTTEAVPAIVELGDTVRAANDELDRVHRLVGRAESISGTVDAGSRLAYRAFSGPVIKAMAAASGTSEAAKGFRRRRGNGRR